MKYDLRLPADNEPMPAIGRFCVKTWQKVFRVLQILHDRRFDFILTPNNQHGGGWEFKVVIPGLPGMYDEVKQEIENA